MSQMIKVCLAGDTNVGKTTIIKRFLDDAVTPGQTTPTIGVEQTPQVTMTSNDNRLFTLSIWDTAGQEQYRSLIPTYFRASNVTLIVTSYDTFSSLQSASEWQNIVFNVCDSCKFILVVNKCDLNPADGVTDSYINEVSRNIGALEVFKVSAITGQGIHDIFQFIVDCPEIESDPQFLNILSESDKQEIDKNGEGKDDQKCC